MTYIVLQHLPPELTKRYLAELVRVLAPGGVLAFQLPSGAGDVPAVEAIPDDAFRAAIRVTRLPDEIPARSVFPLGVAVRNVSPSPWPARVANPLAVGNHWLDAAGSLLRQDDGRTALPAVEPGGELAVTVRCRAPSVPGDYLVEVDIVQEGVTWFAHRGSVPVRLSVKIVDATVRPAPAGDRDLSGEAGDAPPEMGMFGIPIREVVGVLEAGGAVVQSILKDFAAGERWRSYEYIVTR